MWHAACGARCRQLRNGFTFVTQVVITDKWPSYGAAKREICQGLHIISGHLNNRCESAHLPTRQRERRMQRFKSKNRH